MPMDRNLLRFHKSSKLLVLLLLPRIEANPCRRAAIKSPVGIAVNTFQSRTLCGGCLLVLPAFRGLPTCLAAVKSSLNTRPAVHCIVYSFLRFVVCVRHILWAPNSRGRRRDERIKLIANQLTATYTQSQAASPSGFALNFFYHKLPAIQ